MVNEISQLKQHLLMTFMIFTQNNI